MVEGGFDERIISNTFNAVFDYSLAIRVMFYDTDVGATLFSHIYKRTMTKSNIHDLFEGGVAGRLNVDKLPTNDVKMSDVLLNCSVFEQFKARPIDKKILTFAD